MNKLSRSDPRYKYRLLEIELINDIDKESDEKLVADAIEDGLDSEAIAQEFRLAAMNLLAQSRRKLFEETKIKLEKSKVTVADKTPVIRPSIEQMKVRIQALFATKPDLAIAFRNGASQSESDWVTLWEDLVDMGIIKRDDTNN
mgnify:CR=1 FL=1